MQGVFENFLLQGENSVMDNSGLAFEAAEILTRKDGIRAVTRTIGDVKITDVRITSAAAARVGKRAGRYITLEGEPSAAGMCRPH